MQLFFCELLIILFLKYCFGESFRKVIPTNKNTLTQLGNVSEIINLLLVGYDIRLRPDFGGPPLNITMDIAIASFDSISEVNMDYTLTLYLHQHWKDKRLAFSEDNDYEITLNADFAEKIWVPDTFFANDKNSFLHEVTEKNKMIRLKSNGEISYGMRFTTTLACMMDLHYYPLDYQNCTVEIESYGYTVSDVIMFWASTPVVGILEAKLPQFKIISFETNDRSEELATGVYQRLSLSLNLKREIGYFIFQTYLPSTLIVMLSWVGYWLNHEATSARISLGVTTVLTMTTISTNVRSSLPRISYVKAIDIYLVTCFIFVFAALLEYAAVNYSYWASRAKQKKFKKLRTDLQKKLKKNEQKFNEAKNLKTELNDDFQPNLDSFDEQLQTTLMNADDYLLSAALSAPLENGFDLNELDATLELNPGDLNLNNLNSSLNSQVYNVNNLIQNQSEFLFNQETSLPNTNNVNYTEFDIQNENFQTDISYLKTLKSNKENQQNHVEVLMKRLKLLESLRRLTKWTKIKNVNKIDKYSRFLFPTSFIVFNIIYWTFYKF